jgi:catechol 2,3-dioxygenase-like lactoylglutathione lyase family enzyme
MATPKELFSHAATVLPVTDMEDSLAFYLTKIGFQLTFKWGNPPDYAVLKRGDVRLHLSLSKKENFISSRHTAIYIFVYDIDLMHAAFTKNGVDLKPIHTHAYKMRDFDIKDPDGHIISFGKGTD